MGEFATGRIVQFLGYMAGLELLGKGRLGASHEGPPRSGDRAAQGMPRPRFMAPATRGGVASSCGRHCSALRGRTIPASLRLAPHPKTAHSIPVQLPDLGLRERVI